MYAIGLTDTGQLRSQNQDAFFVSAGPVGPLPNLFIVADGMGGHKAGDVASRQAVARFRDWFAAEAGDKEATGTQAFEDYVGVLLAAALQINGELYDMAQGNPDMEGMGTTFIALVVDGRRADIIHVGDSRLYAIYPDKIKQITNDHTYAEEMYRAGEITPEEARTHPKRHHLTRVLGFDPRVELDGFSHDLGDGATSILLCSDGLSNMLDDKALMGIVNREGYVEIRAKALIDEANALGGPDNITAVLIDLRGGTGN
jgi:protein phosphatase